MNAAVASRSTASQSGARTVAVVAFEDTLLLDLTGPLQVFATANELAGQSRRQPYRVRVVSRGGGSVTTAAGLSVATEPWRAITRVRVDTLLIPGGQGVRAFSRDRQCVRWLERRARSARRVCSVCTGAFALAAAGLLDGRRATTHWSAADEFADRFPNVMLDPDAIYVREGRVWTSAGVTAGIDLCLALVEQDEGRELAMDTARHLVVYLKRPGGQSQFSALLDAQAKENGRFDELHAWMVENLDADLSVDRLAERAAMSPRNFARVYSKETGTTPARFVDALRVEAARHALEHSDQRLGMVATRVGFGDEERMRRAFVRRLGVAPGEYRRRFAPQDRPVA
ncbi:MAG: GlxA family transcriptional regulator [Gammaproteobacteria bacterium]